MFLRPLLGVRAQQRLYSSVKNSRTLRPSIKIGKDTFELSINVHHFDRDEIRVKAHPEYVVIEGKLEKDTQQGYILRQFIRKFRLPIGCDPSKIRCSISPDGMLTITAPRSFKDSTTPAEAVCVPISYGPNVNAVKKKEENVGPPQPKTYVNPCDSFPKVKPKDEGKK